MARSKPQRVLVIGAGLAGLIAALELQRQGHEVRVIEASERIGGRIWTWSPARPGGPVAELGAMRIPSQHHTVLTYVREAGLADALVPFASPFATAHGWFQRGGHAARWLDAERRLFARPKLQARTPRRLRSATLRFAHRLEAMVDAVAPAELRERFDAELDGALLDTLDALELGAYLDEQRPRVDITGLFADHPELHRHFSATTSLFLRDVALETQAELFTLAGGMERLPRSLAALLDTPPALASAAVRIERRREDVLVDVAGPQGRQANAYDWVVCTAPFSALRHIELIGLSPAKQRAIETHRYCPAVKALVWSRQPFWLAAGIDPGGGASCVDGPIRQLYYPAARADPDGAILLAAYATGDDARRLSGLPDPQRWRLIRSEAARLHPELDDPRMIAATAFIDWDQQPWIRGGCSVPWIDDREQPNGEQAERLLLDQAEAAARPEGRLLFAGEHCSILPAWLEGAARSALAAVAQVGSQLGSQTDPQTGPQLGQLEVSA